MKTFELINAHGPDHGLSVTVCFYSSRAEVRIREWAECGEPDDRGSYSKHIQEATVDLTDLLDSDGEHFVNVESESMHAKIVSLACNWLSYWGGDEEHVDDDRPCDQPNGRTMIVTVRPNGHGWDIATPFPAPGIEATFRDAKARLWVASLDEGS